MYAIIANHQNKTVTVEECNLTDIKEPCEYLGGHRVKDWANHLAGFMARERGYTHIKEEHESTHRS